MIGIRVGEDLQVKSVVGRRRQVGELFVAIGLLVGDPEVQLHGVPGLGLVVVRADGGVMPANGPPWFFGGGMGMVLVLVDGGSDLTARRPLGHQPFDCDRGS